MSFFGNSGRNGKITESDLPVTVKEKLVKVNEIGDLSQLKTENKSSLTAATNEVTEQLADTAKKSEVRLKTERLKLEDLSPETLGAIEGGEGTTFNLLSIPQDVSVDPSKTTFMNYKKTSKNYYDKNTIINGGYYTNNGGFTTSTSVSSTDFIPISGGGTAQVKVVIGGGYHITYWDADKTFISGEYILFAAGEMKNFTAPLNTKYLKVPVRNNEIEQFFVGVNNDAIYTSIELKEEVNIDKPLKKANISQYLNKLHGLKWGVIGDSISTIGYRAGGEEYPKQIADKNNMTLNNLAVPGSTITKHGNRTDHMCERVLQLDDNCDVVIVAGGVNDKRNNIPLGTMGDVANTTFYGALDVLCRNLITKFHSKPKAIFTPIKYRGNNEALKPYVNAIKEVASKYAIPVLDSFNTCDLQPDIDFINTTYFYQGDGLHPNAEGHAIRARQVENFLNSLV